jgi:hypothetical protein
MFKLFTSNKRNPLYFDKGFASVFDPTKS